MSDSDSDWDNAVDTAEGKSEDDMDGDEDSQEHDDFSEDGSTLNAKLAGETKLSTRPLKHKTSAAALPNPSNFLKRSHQVLFLDEEGDTKNEAQDEETAKRPKKLRRVNFETEDDDGLDHVPSFERVTHRGGYAHTKNSRMKISEANKGKMPWNKGKSRSDAAKSKISAGVRARNHVILLEKLKKLGMSEEEWFEKKVKIKHVREKVRKARLAVKQHELDMEIARKKQEEDNFTEAMIRAFNRGEMEEQTSNVLKNVGGSPLHIHGEWNPEGVGPQDACISSNTGEYEKDKPVNDATPSTENPPSRDTSDKSPEVIKVGRFKDIARAQTNTFEFPEPIPVAPTARTIFDDEIPEAPAEHTFSLSTQEISWEPHDLSMSGVSYSDNCPVGGPGGLICCTSCTSRYSQYLSMTFKDLERHQIKCLGDELEEIMEYSRETKKQLAESTEVAKQKGCASDPIMFS